MNEPPEPNDERFNRSTGVAAAARKAVRTPAEHEAADRSFITRWVVSAYFAFLLVIVGLLVTRAGTSSHWDDAVAQAFELFKIGVLPVVTLVIGHYFGRNERR